MDIIKSKKSRVYTVELTDEHIKYMVVDFYADLKRYYVDYLRNDTLIKYSMSHYAKLKYWNSILNDILFDDYYKKMILDFNYGDEFYKLYNKFLKGETI